MYVLKDFIVHWNDFVHKWVKIKTLNTKKNLRLLRAEHGFDLN